ncbi:hypothetical protein AGABI1DRAFT_129262 [Agaricus bisporus var. burnettii JB137-S8]|uniref:Uncharacterized protein n=1 Tax=Agaricus bisporus var. burnettii (strain JB137-S8 / ATCC MYA-4627 / FGSC 10392) TaxID=597362 RepID=K5WU73_AGABU|nr:uncharacterized protein AGABI1DRAFT_129262 [Agaricus bisporus var. burnettii JB137-S8]EKM78996.1 hypothetical protein AGABI1DRAFT_129262 [Agaricus bisporus var. burnettii JB137-S8]
MAMHPELKRALDANLSALEAFLLSVTLAYQGSALSYGPAGNQNTVTARSGRLGNLASSIGFNLFLSCPSYLDPESPPAKEPCLNVHKDLTRGIISWLSDSERRSNVYLIEEAQTRTKNVNEYFGANVATICGDTHRLGLPLRDALVLPPNISRLCAALAAHYPPFRLILTKILFDNTEIRNLPKRTQFKKLIYEPWKALQISHPQYVAAPPVIVLRWYDPTFWPWDEELLRSIYEFASPRQALPLLWIISFSPEFKLPIQDLFHSFERPRITRLPVSYNDAHTEAESFLRHRLRILCQKHKEMFTKHEVWPSEEQMSHLTRIFLGSFDAVDAVDAAVQFIDWEGDGGPKAHLEVFLAYMVDSPSPSDERQYCALDHFYRQVFSAIPPHLLSIVKQLLSVCYCETFHFASSFQLACLVSCGHDSVLDVLPHLCRWAVISHIKDNVVFYAPSPFFRGFLENAKRSGRFYTRKSQSRFSTYQASIRIVSHSSNPVKYLKSVGRFNPKTHAFEMRRLMDYALDVFYYAPDTGSSSEWTLLRHFDFGCLGYCGNNIPWFDFLSFLQKLNAWDKDNSPNIVRVEPAGDLDNRYIDKCESLAEPLDLGEKGESWGRLNPPGPKYVLLGLEAGTVLVVLATLRSPGVAPTYCGFSIYTSAMLEYM